MKFRRRNLFNSAWQKNRYDLHTCKHDRGYDIVHVEVLYMWVHEYVEILMFNVTVNVYISRFSLKKFKVLKFSIKSNLLSPAFVRWPVPRYMFSLLGLSTTSGNF